MSQNYFSSFDFNFLKFKFFSQIISTVRSPQPTTQISWIGFYRKLILLLRLTLSGFCSASFSLLPLLVGIHPNKYILSFVFSFTKLLFPSSLVFALSRSPSPTRAGGHGGCERPCWRLARRRRPPSSSSVALPRLPLISVSPALSSLSLSLPFPLQLPPAARRRPPPCSRRGWSLAAPSLSHILRAQLVNARFIHRCSTASSTVSLTPTAAPAPSTAVPQAATAARVWERSSARPVRLLPRCAARVRWSAVPCCRQEKRRRPCPLRRHGAGWRAARAPIDWRALLFLAFVSNPSILTDEKFSFLCVTN